ncbi:unnamed protein product [Tetraodon nigroviridis]|uniref:(spotted green pufferfish) hypothetical protein n=1 Tax=Tetraodon nigroviridis TaxID=99883 RepID=Q4T839_TETNG|nr:unnamed protein product [Tetraodon nigroviridis]
MTSILVTKIVLSSETDRYCIWPTILNLKTLDVVSLDLKRVLLPPPSREAPSCSCCRRPPALLTGSSSSSSPAVKEPRVGFSCPEHARVCWSITAASCL